MSSKTTSAPKEDDVSWIAAALDDWKIIFLDSIRVPLKRIWRFFLLKGWCYVIDKIYCIYKMYILFVKFESDLSCQKGIRAAGDAQCKSCSCSLSDVGFTEHHKGGQLSRNLYENILKTKFTQHNSFCGKCRLKRRHIYDSFSDVGEIRVYFASKILTPCRMH